MVAEPLDCMPLGEAHGKSKLACKDARSLIEEKSKRDLICRHLFGAALVTYGKQDRKYDKITS
ncbi:hypothetical protein OUZ56_009858 [Daphnia magna]|uniref:Uncharacterized protein n=1 Tax=Daphnia magna TaxID=35525 RepID=A0ABR0AH48_9CRUS|nr:hypothetical protein OUZ56_009858 [Daphnia magna]